MRYWAVKNPKEHRGVYTKHHSIKEKQGLLFGQKGVEIKSFNSNKGHTLNEALKWAGVSGIADGDSMPCSAQKQENKPKEKNEFEEIVAELSSCGDEIIKIIMNDEKIYCVTVKDVWFVRGHFAPAKSDYMTDVYDNKSRSYIKQFDSKKADRYKQDLHKLPKTSIVYKNNFIIISGYDRGAPIRNDVLLSRECYGFKHQFSSPIALNIANIKSMEPIGYWSLGNRSLYEVPDLVKYLLKEN